jgi:hypothetical protein
LRGLACLALTGPSAAVNGEAAAGLPAAENVPTPAKWTHRFLRSRSVRWWTLQRAPDGSSATRRWRFDPSGNEAHTERRSLRAGQRPPSRSVVERSGLRRVAGDDEGVIVDADERVVIDHGACGDDSKLLWRYNLEWGVEERVQFADRGFHIRSGFDRRNVRGGGSSRGWDAALHGPTDREQRPRFGRKPSGPLLAERSWGTTRHGTSCRAGMITITNLSGEPGEAQTRLDWVP